MRGRSGGGTDLRFLGLWLAVMVVGFMMLASASWPMGLGAPFFRGSYFIEHQILFGFLPGVIGGVVAYLIPYEWYRRAAPLALFLSVVLLLLVFIPGLRADFGTSYSWIRLGSFSFQPSELVKLTYLLYLSAWLAGRSEREISDVHTGLIPFLFALSIIMGLLIAQPDTGTMMIIVAMSLLVYFSAGAPIRYFALTGALGSLLIGLLLVLSPYRANRLLTFLHPDLDPQGIGYHVNQALLAVGSGGIFGRGYGHSVQKYQYLPEVAGDSIFAVMAEEMGFIMTVGFLALYAAFLRRGLKIAEEARDPFGRYVAVGIMGWFGIQALVNISAMVGMMPITGVPLPFVSYGGTALAIGMAACGIMLNIAKNER